MRAKPTKFIPVAEPVFIGSEKEYVLDCIDTTWISSKGKYIQKFEEGFANFCEVKYAVSCSNGTVALHLALLALGIRKGDEVIVPTFTYVATANSVMYVGAKPVFVDSDPVYWNIDPKKIEEAITEKTKAIIVVHIYGHPADIEPIRKIADKYGLHIIEDAAEAHGARYLGKSTGSLGDIATFSFFGNKIITTGEGGMITTNNDSFAEIITQLKGQGLDPIKRYWFPVIGYNYRMTNIQAAIGLAQLEKIDWHLAQRKRIFKTYHKILGGFDQIDFQPEMPGCENSYWMTSIVLGDNLPERDLVMELLFKRGIETRPFFYPMHILPMYQRYTKGQNFPVANQVSKRGLNLPSSSKLTDEDINYICESLISILNF